MTPTEISKFDVNEYLENDRICKILYDSYIVYNLNFYREVLWRFHGSQRQDVFVLKCVIDEVCRDFNETINSFFNDIS